MKIVYLGYWSANDPLTQSVIVPRLKMLAKFDCVKEIVFFSIERQRLDVTTALDEPKLKHIPLQSRKRRNLLLTKFGDFTEFPVLIKRHLADTKVDLFIANSPLAGAIAARVLNTIDSKLVVECFEPHSDYMLESGVWKAWDPRYLILRYFESWQRKHAQWLLTVSNHFTQKLVREGVSAEKIITVPNAVDVHRFAFNALDREQIRRERKISQQALVGIYVGKFGDIYYSDEAFDLFAQTVKHFGEQMHVIILTQHNSGDVTNRLVQRGVKSTNLHILKVLHNQVPAFLSAADFAWSTIRRAPCRLYCCPLKDGEYWANGLPILLEEGIGDDSEIIKHEGGGVILDMHAPKKAFKALTEMLMAGRETLAQQIQPLAVKHRNQEKLHQAYMRILATHDR
jgi:glycosyltransferase involved in cell wall biosynthesis